MAADPHPPFPNVLKAVDALCWEDAEDGGDGWTNAACVSQRLCGDWDGRRVGQSLRHLREAGWLEARKHGYPWLLWAPTEKAAEWLAKQ